MRDYFANYYDSFGGTNRQYYKKNPSRATKNMWLGVTCENQKTADERIPILLDIPATVRFVSCEPLLSNINLFHNKPSDTNMMMERYGLQL